MYVKSTQTDTVSMEVNRNDDEDEDTNEAEVQPTSSHPTTAATEVAKVTWHAI